MLSNVLLNYLWVLNFKILVKHNIKEYNLIRFKVGFLPGFYAGVPAMQTLVGVLLGL